jgi:hypothetical protein
MATVYFQVYQYSFSAFPTPNNINFPMYQIRYDRSRGTRVFSGNVTFGGIPGERLVFLLHVPTMTVYETTISMPDGTFTLSGRWNTDQYLVGVHDHTLEYRPLMHGPF